jgi:hypothetical protein
MITIGYNYIQRQDNSLRQRCPIFMLLRTVLATSVLALLIISPAFGRIPPPQKINPDTKPEPMQTNFLKGTGVLQIGDLVGSIDSKNLAKLGVTGFDGNEKDYVVYSLYEGNLHYILNPNWTGVYVIIEKGIQNKENGKGSVQEMVINTIDGSKILPSTAVKEDGIFAVLSEKGVCVRNKDLAGYNNLSMALKVDKIEGKIRIIFDQEMNQRVIEIRPTNTKEPGIKIGIEKYKADYIR